MQRSARALAPVAVGAALVLGATAGPAAADLTPTVLLGTVVPGVLSISGTGLNVSVSGAPGSLTPAAGVTALVVTDTTGTSNGWAVTATWSAIPGAKDVGGANVLATVGGVAPDLTGGVLASAVTTVTDAALATPVTVATTGVHAGSGITTMTASYKLRLPVTAQAGDVYSGRVTYTVASVR